MLRPSFFLSMCLVLLTHGGCREVRADPSDVAKAPVIQVQRDEEIVSLLDPDVLGPDWGLGGVRVGRDTITFLLRSGDRIVELRLGPPGLDDALHSAHFSIQWRASGTATTEEAESLGIVAASSVVANDWADLWFVPMDFADPPEAVPAVAPPPAHKVFKRIQSLVLRVVYPGLVLFLFLGSLAWSGVILWRSPRRVPLLILAAGAIGMLALQQTRVEPFLGDLQVNMIAFLNRPGIGRYSMVWQSVLQMLPRPWDVDLLAMVNQGVVLALVVPALALLDALFEEVGSVAAGILGLATSTVLILFSASTSKHVLLLYFLVAAAVHLTQWHREGRPWSLLAAAATAACMVDLRPDGIFGLIPLVLLPAGLGNRWRMPGPMVFLASALLFLALSAVALLGTRMELRTPGVTHWVGTNPFFYLAFPALAYSDLLTMVSPILGGILFIGWGVLRRSIRHNRALVWLFLAASMTSLGQCVIESVTSHRYVLVALAFRKMLLGVLAYQLATRLFRRLPGRFAPLASGLATAAVLGGLLLAQEEILEEEWPHAIEYDLLASRVANLPDGSRIVAQLNDSSMREAGLVLPGRGLSRLVGREHVWLSFEELWRVDPRNDNYLFLGTGCWNTRERESGESPMNWTRGHPDCVAVVRTLTQFADLTLLERIYVDAASYAGELPVAEDYPLEWYRIDFQR